MRMRQLCAYGACESYDQDHTQTQPVGVAGAVQILLSDLDLSERMDSDIWNQELDAENGGVPLHIGQIADAMHEWEGQLAEELGLTDADVAEIKTECPKKLKLQS